MKEVKHMNQYEVSAKASSNPHPLGTLKELYEGFVWGKGEPTARSLQTEAHGHSICTHIRMKASIWATYKSNTKSLLFSKASQALWIQIALRGREHLVHWNQLNVRLPKGTVWQNSLSFLFFSFFFFFGRGPPRSLPAVPTPLFQGFDRMIDKIATR